ncbi:uncharacterized protein LOC117641720 [Thrips palmi]|uniref:Uncharacterized protein LOC117641720 n=1 Tax=Thrips palmi TaxID=161013 RepID=A0A6P8ZJD5_THRPL|nr:uncharacterized protein LOC117641720 [Thrips palmi]
MAEAMAQDLERLGVRGLRAHRRVWLGLSKVLSLLSETWGRTHTLVLGLLFVSFASLSFLLLHIVLTRDMLSSIWWFIISYVLTVWSIYSICNSAQHATDSLRRPATKQLLTMSYSAKDDKTKIEILHFLRDIEIERPRVSMCRLTVLSRSSILSLFALANTYIVVLSQFTISVEMAETNFTEDPGMQATPGE